MAISKVILNGETLIDVTDDTVTAGTLLSPETATRADGVQITGAVVTTDDYEDLSNQPQINSVTLIGNKSLSDLGIASASDLSAKQAQITASGILKGNGSGTVTAATAGTDYGTYSKPSGGIPKTDLASAVQTSLGKADTALQTAPVTSVNSMTGAVVLGASDVGAYEKPSTGIPKADLASAVQTSLGKADTALQSAPVTSVNSQTGDVTITASGLGAYVKPSTGIPKTDLAAAVQTSLGKADTALQSAPVTSVNNKTGAVSLTASDVGAYALPSGGIPASDIADGVIPDVSGFYTKPGTGIPKTDLASAVQTSLGKADTALQPSDLVAITNAEIDAITG